MVRLHDLQPADGSKTKRKRVGRGPGSGRDKTAGRGHKGQNARSGGGVRPTFEGGQMPLFRRIPKRGFTSINPTERTILNVEDLNRFDDGTEVSIELLLEEGLINKIRDGVKVLGGGSLERELTVRVHAFSGTAREKIEAAGGKAEVI